MITKTELKTSVIFYQMKVMRLREALKEIRTIQPFGEIGRIVDDAIGPVESKEAPNAQ